MKFTLALAIMLFAQFSFAGTIVSVKTNKGNFEIELDDEKAPISVKNFLSYVDSNFYYGTIFHRSVKNFVVQGGGLTPAMQEKPTYHPIPSEAKNGLSNLKGTIGMARTDDINSATSQFYVNTKDNTGLDYSPTKAGYTVFGKVISGYEVIEVIENAPVHSVGEYDNVPVQPIIIESMKRKETSSESFQISIKAYRDDKIMSSPRIVTLLGQAAEVRQEAGEYYASKAVILEKNSLGKINVNLTFKEHLVKDSFELIDSFIMDSVSGPNVTSVKRSGVIYRYETQVTPISSTPEVDCSFSGFVMKQGEMKVVSGNFNISDSADSSYSTNMSINYEGSEVREYKDVITTRSAGDSSITTTPGQMLKEIKEGNPLVPIRWKEKLEKMALSNSSHMYGFPFTFALQGAYVYRYYDSSGQELGKIFGFGNNTVVVCD